MKECNQIQELIPLGISEDLSAAEMARLQSHLETCPECRQEFETYRTIRNEIAGLRIADSELRNINLEFRTPDLPPQEYIWRYASVAAMFLIGIAAGFIGWGSLKSSPPPRTEPVAASSDTSALLGAELQPVSEAMEQHLGLPPCQGFVISNLKKQCPAERMGFKPGDVLISVNGKPVTSTSFTLDKHNQIKVVRNGIIISITINQESNK